MYIIQNGEILCGKKDDHKVPNFIVNGNELHLDNVEFHKEFRVICDQKDVTGYILENSTMLKTSSIMGFIDHIGEDYAKYLQGKVPSRLLDVLTETESMLAMDSRIGTSIGIRRFLEALVIENFAVLIYKPSLFGKFISLPEKENLWNKHLGMILKALLSSPKGDSDFIHKYVNPVKDAKKNNPKFRNAVTGQPDLSKLLNIYEQISKYIHGATSQLDRNYLKDSLEFVLQSTMSFVKLNMGWGFQ